MISSRFAMELGRGTGLTSGCMSHFPWFGHRHRARRDVVARESGDPVIGDFSALSANARD